MTKGLGWEYQLRGAARDWGPFCRSLRSVELPDGQLWPWGLGQEASPMKVVHPPFGAADIYPIPHVFVLYNHVYFCNTFNELQAPV